MEQKPDGWWLIPVIFVAVILYFVGMFYLIEMGRS